MKATNPFLIIGIMVILVASLAFADPEINLTLPVNTSTYNTTPINLTWVSNVTQNWSAYMLDFGANVTLTTNLNTTLIYGVTPGVHNITVFVNDSASGTMYSSNTTVFTLEANPPYVAITSPTNNTYNSTSVAFNYTSNETLNWSAYSLNGAANVSITANTTLYLDSGAYNITFCGNDSAGNMNCTIPTYFTMDNPATILIISPVTGTTYRTNVIDFTWSSSELLNYSVYSLDGAANVSVTANITFTDLAAGSHTVVLCGNDSSGSGEFTCNSSTFTQSASVGACTNIFSSTSDAFVLGAIILIVIAAVAVIMALNMGLGAVDFKVVIIGLIVGAALLIVGYNVIAITYSSIC